MKEFIQKRWIVEGYYRFDNKTSSWVFAHEYIPGKTVWEFGRHTLTCSVDECVDHIVPYTVVEGDILVIDFSSLIPHFNRHIESYKVMRRGS